MREWGRGVRKLTLWPLSFILGGCGGAVAKTPPPTATDTALVGRPCDALRPPNAAKGPEAVFVEVADVVSLAGGPSARQLASPVHVRFVAGVLLADRSDSAPPENAISSETDALLVRLRSVPADANSPVELEIEVGKDPPRRAIVRTKDQAPLVVAREGGALVVTPDFLYEPRPQSLQRLKDDKLAESSRC